VLDPVSGELRVERLRGAPAALTKAERDARRRVDREASEQAGRDLTYQRGLAVLDPRSRDHRPLRATACLS
jgi:hypothetical protein